MAARSAEAVTIPARPPAAARAYLVLAALALLAAGGQAGAQNGGKRAWTQANVSGGLHRLEHDATVAYRPPAGQVPPGSVITRVYADRDYAGQADVQTSLCWNGMDRCIGIAGRSVHTRAFNDLDAGQPMILVHRVKAWRGSGPPLYVKGNVSVWYEAGEAHSAR